MHGKFILLWLVVTCGCSMWPTPPEPQRNKALRLVAEPPSYDSSFFYPKPNGNIVYCLKMHLGTGKGDIVKVEVYSGTISCVVEGDFVLYDIYENENIAILSSDSALLLYNINTGVLDTLLFDELIHDVAFLDSVTLILLKSPRFYKLTIGDTTLELLFAAKEGTWKFDISPSGEFIVADNRKIYDFNGIEKGVVSEGRDFAFSPKNDSIIVFASSEYEGYLGIANWVLDKVEYLDSKVAGNSDARTPCFSSYGNKIFFVATNPGVAGLIFPYQRYFLWEYSE